MSKERRKQASAAKRALEAREAAHHATTGRSRRVAPPSVGPARPNRRKPVRGDGGAPESAEARSKRYAGYVLRQSGLKPAPPSADAKPKPEPVVPRPRTPIRSPEDAERAAAAHLRWLGFADATVTVAGPDGGVDVSGTGVVAQVKAEMKPVALQVVQQLFGVASLEQTACAVFALAGFTPQAIAWAARANVPLFRFDYEGTAEAVNEAAHDLEARQQRGG